MNAKKAEESCAENKQSVTPLGSPILEGSYGFSRMSAAGSSPATTSPSHRRMTGPIRRAKGGWTPEEDETLKYAVELHKARSWKKIANSVPGRTEVQCLHRWQKVLNPELVKGSWVPEEDGVIIKLVAQYGPTKWSLIARSLPGRIGKQCRERWHNHLNPDIRKDAWTPEEEMKLMEAHLKHGNKWAEIAKMLPGRTDNSIKNHWNSSLRKRMEFFLKTGKLPPAPKPGIPNCVEDTTNSDPSQNFNCSNKRLVTSAKILPESYSSVRSSRPPKTSKAKGQKSLMVPISVQLSELNSSLDVVKISGRQNLVVPLSAQDSNLNDPLVMEVKNSGSSNDPECQTQASEKDFVHNKSYSGVSCFTPEVPVSVQHSELNSSLDVAAKKSDRQNCLVPISAQVSNLNISLVIEERKSDRSNAPECPAHASEKDFVHNRSDSGVSCFTPEVLQNEEPSGAILYPVSDNLSSLCYKPPQLGDIDVSAFSSLLFGNNSTKPAFIVEMVSSPDGYSTPSSVNVIRSVHPSIESILRSAARSFQNTPSIIKRRSEVHSPLSHVTIGTNEIRMLDSSTPNEERVNNIKGSAYSVSKLFSSSCTANGDVLDKGNDFDISPPYRLWSKRKATFKPVEKQLDFSLKKANLSISNFLVWKLARTPIALKKCNVSTMQEKKLKNNLAGSKEGDFSNTVKLGVT